MSNGIIIGIIQTFPVWVLFLYVSLEVHQETHLNNVLYQLTAVCCEQEQEHEHELVIAEDPAG